MQLQVGGGAADGPNRGAAQPDQKDSPRHPLHCLKGLQVEASSMSRSIYSEIDEYLIK